MKKFLSKLHWQVAIALVLSVVVAFFIRCFELETTSFAKYTEATASFIGNFFMRLLSMIVVPLVVTSVVCGSMSLGNSKKFLRIGFKTLFFYFITGALAIALSVFLVNVIKPGAMSVDVARNILGEYVSNAPKVDANVGSFSDVILKFIPPNIVEAASDNTQLLGLIIFAVVIGIFINTLPEQYAEFQRKFWSSFNELFEKITNVIMRLLPIGVFGLTAPVCMRAGAEVIGPVLLFFATVVSALALHTFVTMSLVLMTAKISPIKHLKTMLPALLTAFSTSSSVATLPVTLECVENGARVPKNISGFTLPLGATVNMNGSALYECVAVIFISQIYASAGGDALSIGMQFLVMALALLTSVGVAGIPSASLVAIVVIMGVAGIPAEAIGVVWMTDRILDMMRTSVNIYGDACAAVWIAKTEGCDIYNT